VTVILSHIAALNPYYSLNTFRQTDNYRFNETRLQQMSPSSKENMINAYNGELGIPNADAFENHVKDYLDKKDDAFSKLLSESAPPSEIQKQKYAELDAIKTALKYELLNFTDKVTKLPANTHAETLASVAREERGIIIAKIEILNKKTHAFTNSLTPKTPADTATTGAAAINTTAMSTAPAPKEDFTPLPAENIQNVIDALPGTTPAKDPAFEQLKTELTDDITNIDRAATIERGRTPLFVAFARNRDRLNKFTNTLNSMKEPFSLFSSTKPSPFSVLTTGADQKEVNKLRHAMQHLDLKPQDQKALDEARANLKKSEAELKKAEKRDEKTDNADEIKKYNDEIEKYNQDIKIQQDKIAAGAVLAAQELTSKDEGTWGQYFGLVGYDPGLTSLSGKRIKVTANDQGLGFAIDFPSPLLDPNYWISPENYPRADLRCMAELIKATGAKTITTTIKSGMFANPERELRLAQQAWEENLAAGFKEEKITIKMGDRTMTKEQLFPQSEEDKKAGRPNAKLQRAESFQKTAAEARASAAAKAQADAPKEIAQQQKVIKDAMAAGRNNLEKLAPTPPSESAEPPTASI